MNTNQAAGTIAVPQNPPLFGPNGQAADKWLFLSMLFLGSGFLWPLAVLTLMRGAKYTRLAREAGEFVRPASITIFGLFASVDAGANLFGWALDWAAFYTRFGQVFMEGFGRMFDAAYYYDYNTGPLLGQSAPDGEKAFSAMCVYLLFPIRIAAAWAFLKMKRWGYDFMIITAWMYIFFWFGYGTNLISHFPTRMGATEFGVIGYWIFNIAYIGPFITLPFLYMLNPRRWNQ